MQIRLVPVDSELAAALASGPQTFASSYSASLMEVGDLVQAIVEHTLAMTSATPPWGGYLCVDTDAAVVVGTCGFKAAPAANGDVEIAYFTFPNFEGRGYATQMTEALINIAAPSPNARRVIAHTLPEQNASTRVLEKSGMCFVGEVIDPDDGLVWRWEMRLPAT